MTKSREISIENCWKYQNVIINTLSCLHLRESGQGGHGREIWHDVWSENPTGNFPSSNAVLRCLHSFSRQEVPKLPPEAHSSSIETSEGTLKAGIKFMGTCWGLVFHFLKLKTALASLKSWFWVPSIFPFAREISIGHCWNSLGRPIRPIWAQTRGAYSSPQSPVQKPRVGALHYALPRSGSGISGFNIRIYNL